MTDNDDRPDLEERGLLDRYEANLTAAKKALAAADRQPLIPGSTGQRRSNPLYGVAETCDRLALAYFEQLLALRERRSKAAELGHLRDMTAGT